MFRFQTQQWFDKTNQGHFGEKLTVLDVIFKTAIDQPYQGRC